MRITERAVHGDFTLQDRQDGFVFQGVSFAMVKWVLIVVFLTAVVAQLAWWAYGRSLEQPTYTVVAEAGGYELRRYEPYLVAETSVTGTFEDAGNVAFRTLAAYIFGDNTGDETMSMTAPVVSSQGANRRGADMAMTTPVLSSGSGGECAAVAGNVPDEEYEWVYQFVMERKYSLESLPRPTDPSVVIRSVPGRLVAARHFGGRWLADRVCQEASVLMKAIRADGLRAVGRWALARYNDPFTPSFLRRNEVLVEVAVAG